MNPKKTRRIRETYAEINQIIERLNREVPAWKDRLARIHPNYRKSALNLIHYRTLRSLDISDLQKRLGNLGLSRLARSQGHVMASLLNNQAFLKALVHDEPVDLQKSTLSIKRSRRLLRSNAKALLGYRSKGRRTRIMVTLPSEAAENYPLVEQMIAAGMNCARINCAHDGPEVWQKMIDHVRAASQKLRRNCKIAMDLGGPKIRTGALAPGPEVVKMVPERDPRGKVIQPEVIWIGERPDLETDLHFIPVRPEALHGLAVGDTLYLTDTRGKDRSIQLTQIEEKGCLGACFDTIYIETGAQLFRDKERQSAPILVEPIDPIEQRIILQPGDLLRIHRDPMPGQPAQYDEWGHVITPAHVSCTAPEVFERVQAGDPVLFDDGKIRGRLQKTGPDELLVEITYARSGGGKLKADKGINFPESDLQIRGLTDKDRSDLMFVAPQADVINMSFVNGPEDVADLIRALDDILAEKEREQWPGVILKIETQKGFDNLTDILMEAMQLYPVGVMIARGDLAVEVGWNNIGRVQEELLSFCQAAHLTDIWATQVLEHLAKKGIPSRAEITDAAMAQRADCVMLNKGPYILEAIRLLDTILKDLDPYRDKNTSFHPSLAKASR